MEVLYISSDHVIYLYHLQNCRNSAYSYELLLGAVHTIVKERYLIMPIIPVDIFGRHVLFGKSPEEPVKIKRKLKRHPYDLWKEEDEVLFERISFEEFLCVVPEIQRDEYAIIELIRQFFSLAVSKGDMISERTITPWDNETTGFFLPNYPLSNPPESELIFDGYRSTLLQSDESPTSFDEEDDEI